MSQSLSKIYVHIIFSTKKREPILKKSVSSKLYQYLGGICSNLKCNPVQIGGFKDHVHILCLLSKGITVIQLVQHLKQGSSKWIKLQSPELHTFYWQKGYAVYSVNPRNIEKVSRYIINQPQHHRNKTFKEELIRMLDNLDMQYDPEYLFD